MLASLAARASPAAESRGSAEPPRSFSAWRTTMTVVASAVAQTQAAKIAKLNTPRATSADSQIGVKKGRRWKLTGSFFMAP